MKTATEIIFKFSFFFSSVNKVRCPFFSEKSIPFCSCFLTKFWVSDRKTFFCLSISKLKIPKKTTFFRNISFILFFYYGGESGETIESVRKTKKPQFFITGSSTVYWAIYVRRKKMFFWVVQRKPCIVYNCRTKICFGFGQKQTNTHCPFFKFSSFCLYVWGGGENQSV